MVKLASARESRMYGTRLTRNRAEYINAGLYLFATVLLFTGFAAGFSFEPKLGLVLLLVALILITAVNVHDLLAHLAGIDYRFGLLQYDTQFALVEFAVPLIYAAGSLVFFVGILFVFLQVEKKKGYLKFQKHALNMLIAGPALWVIGSIHNSCQIYERADGHVQILQESVLLPFVMGSLLFLVGAVLNTYEQSKSKHFGAEFLGTYWMSLGIVGTLLFFIGGLANLVKVFNMQQVAGLRLEKLRGGAQERLIQEREGQAPLIIEEQGRRRTTGGRQVEETKALIVPGVPYKDVLVGPS